MTNKELVTKLQNIAINYKTVYMWGVFGSPVTEELISSKTKQYPSWYTNARQKSLRSLIGKGYFSFDCVNLIKSVLWGWSGNSSKSNGGAIYNSNGIPDINADTMISRCNNVSTNFSNVEIGEVVWMTGHIGVYVGNGKVIECTPSWSNNVQITALKNLGTISGLNARTWTKHGKLPYITYEKATITSVKDAINKLVLDDIILSPDYWIKNYNKLEYLDALLINMANGTNKNAKGSNICTVKDAIAKLVSAKIINSPDYWSAHYTKIQYLDALLIKVSNKV